MNINNLLDYSCNILKKNLDNYNQDISNNVQLFSSNTSNLLNNLKNISETTINKTLVYTNIFDVSSVNISNLNFFSGLTQPIQTSFNISSNNILNSSNNMEQLIRDTSNILNTKYNIIDTNSSNYNSNVNFNIVNRIQNLNINNLVNGSINKYIENNVFNNNLLINGNIVINNGLFTSNIARADAKIIANEIIEIISYSSNPALSIQQNNNNNILEIIGSGNSKLIVNNTGNFGIKTNPNNSNSLEIIGDINCSSGLYSNSSPFSYFGLSNIPLEFAPSSHTHSISDITGLSDILNTKQDKINALSTVGSVLTLDGGINLSYGYKFTENSQEIQYNTVTSTTTTNTEWAASESIKLPIKLPVIIDNGKTGNFIEIPNSYDIYYAFTSTTGINTIQFFQDTFCDILVVAGGGGGGFDMGGGGGGGGVISISQNITPGTYNIIVGKGGDGAPAAGTNGQPTKHQYSINAKKGGNSSFGTIEAIGGGYGGSSVWTHALGGQAGSGGSGGGSSGYNATNNINKAGTGITGQGFRGGYGGQSHYSGGGGGAGEIGGGPSTAAGGAKGGDGKISNILGRDIFWGGGGGGAGYTKAGGNGGKGGGGGGAVGVTFGGVGGLTLGSPGGGGSTSAWANKPGGDGGMNTGGGGGGGSHYNSNNKGGDGGSGIVIIKIKNYKIYKNIESQISKPITEYGETINIYDNFLEIKNYNSNIIINNEYKTNVINPVNNAFIYEFGVGINTITFNNDTYCDILLVGGGASGSIELGTGGISGNLVYAKDILVPRGNYTITVGAGGALGARGEDTIAFGATAKGGQGYSIYEDILPNPLPLIDPTTYVTSTTGSTLQYVTGSTENIYYSFTTVGSGNSIEFNTDTYCEILVVGGGGAGAGSIGGGGGAGAVVYIPMVLLSAGTYSVTVGNGGTSTNGKSASGSGGQSSLSGSFGTIIAEGGGGVSYGHSTGDGLVGGSGGGASGPSNTHLNIGGAAGTSSSLGGLYGYIYGNRGGNNTVLRTGGPTNSAGGGGAGAPALDTNPNGNAGNGGEGIQINITGNNSYYGGGGGGGGHQASAGTGGLGGGGNGARENTRGTNGVANTGGGGGGGGWDRYFGGNGGSGIVIIRILTNISENIIPNGANTNRLLTTNEAYYVFTRAGPYNNIKFLKNTLCDVFMIGGGGGGGYDFGGGGGAGAYYYGKNITFNKDTVYNITVGDGGEGAKSGVTSFNGDDTSIITNISCIGTSLQYVSGSDEIYYKFTTVNYDHVITFNNDTLCDILIVGGGGGGGKYVSGNYELGGGGAGAYLFVSSVLLNGTYNITVGDGGAVNNKGFDSIIKKNGIDIYRCEGGGLGGYAGAGGNGGSGGGGQWNNGGGTATDQTKGKNGAAGTTNGGKNQGGGGGGAGSNGSEANGGNGLSNDISGTLTWYAGGGGGNGNSNPGGTGGIGGGGTGSSSGYNATSGINGTGGGGGGGYYTNSRTGGEGGSGIVIIRIKDSNISSLLVKGGGGGGDTIVNIGKDGGCGGGGNGWDGNTAGARNYAGGSTINSGTVGFGFAGGTSYNRYGTDQTLSGGGGGGIGSIGSSVEIGYRKPAGNGGNALSINIKGIEEAYGGGGGGGTGNVWGGTAGLGGGVTINGTLVRVGGNGTITQGAAGGAGVANTGSGGGSGKGGQGGKGGSGLVIIRAISFETIEKTSGNIYTNNLPNIIPPLTIPSIGSYPVPIYGTSNMYYSFTNVGSNNSITFDNNTLADILIVGGGGSGGISIGGGGGAGGVVYIKDKIINAGTYTINVGAGGIGQTGITTRFSDGNNGSSSWIKLASDADGVYTVIDGITLEGKGGGKGGSYNDNVLISPGVGGSGGGVSESNSFIAFTGGSSNQGNTYWNGLSYIAGGNNGVSSIAANGNYYGTGGGGMGDRGFDDTSTLVNGTPGIQIPITGDLTYYAAGGGAGTTQTSGAGLGGSFIGGNGCINVAGAKAGNGVNGTGSGGGGGGYDTSGFANNGTGNGGSGIVIIKVNSSTLTNRTLINTSNVSKNLVAYQGAPFLYNFYNDTTNLVVWYKFDGNMLDSSGNDNHANYYLNTPPTYDTSIVKTGTSSISLTSTSSQYVNVPAINYNTFDGLTFSAWVYFKSVGSYDRIIDFGDGSGINNIIIAKYGSTNQIVISIYNGSTIKQYRTTNNIIVLNTWIHICWVITKTTPTWKLYVNNVSVGLTVISGSAVWPSSTTYYSSFIGKSNWTSDSYFNGNIDDFRIYNKAISANEVAELYSQKTGEGLNLSTFYNDSSDMIAWYKFDDTDISAMTNIISAGSNFTNSISDASANAILSNSAFGSMISTINGNGTINYILRNTTDKKNGLSSIEFLGGGGTNNTNLTFLSSANSINLKSIYKNNNKGLTLLFWIKINTLGHYMKIFSHQNFYIQKEAVNTGNGVLNLYLRTGTGTTFVATQILSSLTTGIWELWVFSFEYNTNTTTNFKFYKINSNVVAPNYSGTLNWSEDTADSKFFIGGWERGATDTPLGNTLIDDVRIYNRVLTSSEIDILYRQVFIDDNIKTFYNNTSNMIVWYKFDGNLIDSSGNNNTLTNSNSVFNNLDYETGSNSLQLSTTSYVYIPSPSNNYFSPDGSFTYAFWVKISSYTGLQLVVVCRTPGATTSGWNIVVPANTTSIYTETYTSSGGTLSGNFELGTSWNHIAFTLTYTSASIQSYTLYINGVPRTTKGPGNIYTPCTVGALYFGRDTNGSGYTVNNTLYDDFRMYNRVLTPSEIAVLANNIGGGGGSVVNPGSFSTTISTLGKGGNGINIPIRNNYELFCKGGNSFSLINYTPQLNYGYGGDGSMLSTYNKGGDGIAIIKVLHKPKIIASSPVDNIVENGAYVKPIQIATTKYYYYAFTSTSGTNTITFNKNTVCDILVVAGGGGGGYRHGAGGGAGGLIYMTGLNISTGTYSVVVGEGGRGGYNISSGKHGFKGVNSSFGTIEAIGGGGGVSHDQNAGRQDGGSGGGGISTTSYGTGVPGQGNNGGISYQSGHPYNWGGGGGAGEAGGASTSSASGKGGDGREISITGVPTYYAGGGGGGGHGPAGERGLGGLGGGGDAGNPYAYSQPGGNGVSGTGGGGGGASTTSGGSGEGGAGGSGIVIIRWAINEYDTQDPIIIPETNYQYYAFTSTTITNTISFQNDTVCDVLMVGGGGAGSASIGSGGGGGGVVYSKNVIIPSGTYYINIGNGGKGSRSGLGLNGGNTTAFGAIAIGGGGGGRSHWDGGVTAGVSGGSGGGGGSTPARAGGSVIENTIGTILSTGVYNTYGNAGGSGGTQSTQITGGGGGGAGAVGGNGLGAGAGGVGTNGGDGILINITGDNFYWAGGGAGGSYGRFGGNGGKGGGGGGGSWDYDGGTGGDTSSIAYNPGLSGLNGGRGSGGSGGNGGANTGGGGGGSGYTNFSPGDGGSGIVIIRWKNTSIYNTTEYTSGGLYLHDGNISTITGDITSIGGSLVTDNFTVNKDIVINTNGYTDKKWKLYSNNDNQFDLSFDRSSDYGNTWLTQAKMRGNGGTSGYVNFTGMHHCKALTPDLYNDKYIGYIVSSTKQYQSMNSIYDSSNIQRNIDKNAWDALPIVALSTEKDKKVFGVIAKIEDESNQTREEVSGNIVNYFEKKSHDRRLHIAGVGEGGIWVCDYYNTGIESGDYITSSPIPGVGMKQDDDLVRSYTVGKATMDCDFNPKLISVKILTKIGDDYDKDSNGDYIYSDLIDESGNIIYEEEYEIKYVTIDGTVLDIDTNEYKNNTSNYPNVYKMAFIGCSYTCS